MPRTRFAAIAATVCVVACAPTAVTTVDFRGDALPAADMNAFAAVMPVVELTCTNGGKKCVSDYAFPCPDGWSPCSLSGTEKTCCAKTAAPVAPQGPDSVTATRRS